MFQILAVAFFNSPRLNVGVFCDPPIIRDAFSMWIVILKAVWQGHNQVGIPKTFQSSERKVIGIRKPC